jgi:hypothetical protein
MTLKSAYPPEIAERILQRLAAGEHLSVICRDPDLPSMRTVLRWNRDNPDFAEEYQLARTAGAYEYARQAQELIDSITDRDSAIAARAKFEVLRWAAGVHAPRVFGDRLDVDVGVKVDLTSILERRRQNVLEANARLGIAGPEGDIE